MVVGAVEKWESRGLRDFKEVGAVKTCFWFSPLSILRLFHGALGLRFDCHRPALAVVPAHHVRAEANRHRPVQMLVDRHRLLRQAVSPARFIDLPPTAADRHRVVLVDHPLRLHREDEVQVLPAARPEGRSALLGRHSELSVEFRRYISPAEIGWPPPAS